MPTVLVVEDDQSSRDGLVTALSESSGTTVLAAASGEEAIARLKLTPIDVVISDVMMGRVSGMDLLGHIQEHHPDTAVILMTAYGSIDAAVEAMRCGAYDYITKPIDLDRLDLLVARALHKQTLLRENRELRHALRRQESAGIIGTSASMRRVMEQVEQVAPTNASVLILGESGTGKELVAKAIHQHSRRSEQRLVSVNCAALPESLIESELFGHERGAFTGAQRTHQGRFELAHGGTLFLDEIGELSPAIQVKLLRVLQEREIERIGGSKAIAVDVRLVCATNRDIDRAVREGRFREDLFYRIKVVTIPLPPLRDRPEDIPLLLGHFLNQAREEHGKRVRGFTHAAQRALMGYSWPGNVRELRNLVESLVVTSRSDEIAVQNLPPGIVGEREPLSLTVPMGKALAEIEQQYILRTLDLLDGNKTRAAQVLGIGKKTLYRRLQQYGIELGEHEREEGGNGHALDGADPAESHDGLERVHLPPLR